MTENKKGPGRPKKQHKRIQFSLSLEVVALLRQMAENSGESMTSIVESSILAAAQKSA